MKWISSILDGLDIKISIKNMEKGIVYLFLGAVIYFVLPNNILNNIYQKLTNNKTINMIVIILFFSIGTYYIKRIVEIVIKTLKIKKSQTIEYTKIEVQLSNLSFECIAVIKKFYNEKNNSFSEYAKIIPKEPGVNLLEQMGVIEFHDRVSLEGGYSINREQIYQLQDNYLIFFNNKKFLNGKSKLLNDIKMI